MAVRKTPHSATWSIAEAKADLEQVMDEADAAGPQKIARHGDENALLVPAEEWEPRPWLEGSLIEFFHRSGLGDADLDISRHPDTIADLRDIDI